MRIRSALAVSLSSAAALFSLTVPAYADSNVITTAYKSDECSSSNNNHCFALLYNSQATVTWNGACFLTDKSIPDLDGYYTSGGEIQHTVYVFAIYHLNFDYYNLDDKCYNGNGTGQPVKNNAAAADNALVGHTARVYYNSGYAGPSQDVSPGQIMDFNSTLKNEDASVKIL
jgi:hypothetical protein